MCIKIFQFFCMWTNAKLLWIYWCYSCVTCTPEVLCTSTTEQLISYKSKVLFSFFFSAALWLKHLCTLNKYQNEAWSHWPMAWQCYITNHVSNPFIPLFISGTILRIIFVRGTNRCYCLGKSGTTVMEIGQDSVKSAIEFRMHLLCGSFSDPMLIQYLDVIWFCALHNWCY